MAESRKGDNEERYIVGLDAGSVSLNGVVINDRCDVIRELPYRRHLGRPEREIRSVLEEVYETLGWHSIRAVAFTGNHGRRISDRVGGFFEFETISQVLGAVHVRPDVCAMISMGGQDTSLFQISHGEEGGELEYFNTNGPCASGTGSFIDQQAQRLATALYDEKEDISSDEVDRILKDFIRLGLTSEHAANVACRCTVFTKSDMIHLQNQGREAGRHHLRPPRGQRPQLHEHHCGEPQPGGPRSLPGRAFLERTPGPRSQTIRTRPDCSSVQHLHGRAGGCDCRPSGRGSKNRPDLRAVLSTGNESIVDLPLAPPLALRKTDFPESNRVDPGGIEPGTPVYLGIDIGSTTTKYAIIDENRRIIHKSYVSHTWKAHRSDPVPPSDHTG